jgi:NADH-quinone oxidoreductase subunit N
MFLGVFNLRKWLLPVIVAGLLVAGGLLAADWGLTESFFHNMVVIDNFYVAFGGLMIATALVVFILSAQYYRPEVQNLEAIYALMIFTLIGGLIMAASTNLITFFVGLEILSVSLYLLAGSKRESNASNEAAMKYFIMGSFASAFLLFGITLLFGATNSLYNLDIATYINAHSGDLPMLLKAGIILVAVGLAFKVAAAPFHFWAPDVYHGSPTLISSYMITTVKIAGFAAFLRLTSTCFGSNTAVWTASIAIISVLSIVIGNFSALAQTNAKRMLAYSSIAHTGYLLLAVLAVQTVTPSIILYYSAAYVIANLIAFAVLISLKQTTGSSAFESFNGLAKTNPLMAACMAVAMLSLTGIPPLAGFMAKYVVFTSTIQQGYLWLVIVAIVGSVISIFYYFKPIINMYMKAPVHAVIPISKLTMAVIVVLTLLTLVLGFLPGCFLWMI